MQQVAGLVGPGLLEEALDALPYNVCILDRDCTIVAANQAWMEFGRSNGLAHKDGAVGVNYADCCNLDSDGATALHGIVSVQEGLTDRFQMNYPCHSPTRRRWFTMVAARAGEHVVITHRETSATTMLRRHHDVPRDLLAILAGDAQARMEPTDVSTVVQDTMESFQQVWAAEGTSVTEQIHPCTALVDRDLLTRAVAEVFDRCPPGALRIGVAQRDGDAVISVHDTGRAGPWDGFGFEPFDWQHWDGGLGLPYARAVVQLHEGRLSVTEAEGTQVEIRLPAVPTHKHQ